MFTGSDVVALRQKTGAGILDCKKALTETDGDMDKAVDYLREKGIATAAKKAGRIAAEGVCYAEVKGNTAVLVEVNCESDFVSRERCSWHSSRKWRLISLNTTSRTWKR